MAAGQQIVQHRHLRKQFAVLEGARDAEPRDLVRRAAGDVLAAEADRAAAAIDAADAVEHAGLAGAVRADQREQLAGGRPQTTRRRARSGRRNADIDASTASSAIPPPRPAILLDAAVAAALAAGLSRDRIPGRPDGSQPLAVAVEHDAAVLHHVAVVGDLPARRRRSARRAGWRCRARRGSRAGAASDPRTTTGARPSDSSSTSSSSGGRSMRWRSPASAARRRTAGRRSAGAARRGAERD